MELERYFARILRDGKNLQLMGPWIQRFFRHGLGPLRADDFDDSVDAILGQAQASLDAHAKFCLTSWQYWAAASSTNGAGQARSFTNAKAVREVFDWGCLNTCRPHVLADKSMRVWEGIWTTHDVEALELPLDAAEWGALPGLTAGQLRQATLAFPWKMGDGRWLIGPRPS